MQGKKKYFAIVLFLFLGLMIFTFANPNDEETNSLKTKQDETKEIDKKKKKDNQDEILSMGNEEVDALIGNTNVRNTEKLIDNSYDNALAAVILAEKSLLDGDVSKADNLINLVNNSNQQQELNNRLDVVKDSINAIKLVETLENKVDNSVNISDMNNSRDYRTDKNIIEVVRNLKNDAVKSDLTKRLNKLSKILDDTSAPVISGIDDGTYINGEVSIDINDDNEISTNVKLDGNEIQFINNFDEEGIYIVEVVDAAYNTSSLTFTIDKTVPSISGIVNNSLVNKNEIVYVSDKNLDQVIINGKVYNDADFTVVDGMIKFTKKFATSGTYNIVAIDKAANKSEIEFTLDKVAPTAVVTKSNNDKSTNQDVVVTLTGSEELKDITDWNRVDDKTFTRTYSENGKYSVEITDMAGNKSTVNFEVKRIDKVAPTAVVTKSNNDKSTNQDVVVTLVSNEAIYTPEGFTMSTINKEHEFTKTYSENGKYSVEIMDKAGNKSVIKFEVKRIDKVAPTAVVTKSNNDKSTNQDVVVTLVSNEAIYTPEGFTMSTTNKEHEFTRTYSENGKYSVEIMDKAGNVATVEFEVKGIDRVAPQIKLNGDKKITLEAGIDTYTELGATVTDNVDETITDLQPLRINYSVNGQFVGKVDNVDTTKPGVYKITYEYTDQAGNKGIDADDNRHEYALKTVTVQDTVVSASSDNDVTNQNYSVESTNELISE